MTYTEDLLSGMAKELHGIFKLKYESHDKKFEIDFTSPFAQIDQMSGLEVALGMSFPKATELNTEEARNTLDKICKYLKVECTGARTASRWLDKLVGEYLESECINL